MEGFALILYEGLEVGAAAHWGTFVGHSVGLIVGFVVGDCPPKLGLDVGTARG